MTTPRKSRDPRTPAPRDAARARRLAALAASRRPRRRCSSPRAISTTRWSRPRRASRATTPGFIYSRFANPTVAMFEQRMALLEGAEAARATASGMAAVTAALMGQLKAGDHVVAAQGAVRLVPLRRRGAAAALRRRLDAGRRRRPRRMARRDAAQHQDRVSRKPDQSDARDRRHRRRRRDPARRPARRWWSTTSSPRRCCSGRSQLGADCVVYSATKHIDGQGRVLGGVILASREIHRRPHPQFPAPDRPVPVAVQRLGDAEVAGDAAGARRAQMALARRGSPISWPTDPSVARVLYPGRADHPQPALARRQMAGGGTLVAFEVDGGKAAAFARRQRAVDHRHLQQSRRRQEPHHPSRDDDPSAPEARAARRARHRSPDCCGCRSGLEDVDDLIEDLEQALDKAAAEASRRRVRLSAAPGGCPQGPPFQACLVRFQQVAAQFPSGFRPTCPRSSGLNIYNYKYILLGALPWSTAGPFGCDRRHRSDRSRVTSEIGQGGQSGRSASND